MDAKVIAAMVVLVIGLIITIGVVASAVNDGDKAKDEMLIANYKPPPPPSPIPSPPPPPVSPSPSPPPPATPLARRVRILQDGARAIPAASLFKLTNAETVDILTSRAKKSSTTLPR